MSPVLFFIFLVVVNHKKIHLMSHFITLQVLTRLVLVIPVAYQIMFVVALSPK